MKNEDGTLAKMKDPIGKRSTLNVIENKAASGTSSCEVNVAHFLKIWVKQLKSIQQITRVKY